MKNELRHSAHTVGETNLHLQFTPAYRRDIFREPLARELTIAYLVERAQQLKVHVAAIDCGPDHIHLFVEDWKNYASRSADNKLVYQPMMTLLNRFMYHAQGLHMIPHHKNCQGI